MPLPNMNFVGALNEMMKEYHTVQLKLKAGSDATEALQRDVRALRTEVGDLKAKVAALEESRNTLRAEMQALKAETLAELRAVKAETVAELKVQQVKYEADLYRKFMDQLAASRQDSPANKTPQIEK